MANKNQKSAYEPRVRAKWYFLVEKAGKTVDEVCGLYFISRKTYYKWRKKDGGNRTHISKKEHPGTKIKGEIKVFICNEKTRINYGPLKISCSSKKIQCRYFNYRHLQILQKEKLGLSSSKEIGLIRAAQRPFYTSASEKRCKWTLNMFGKDNTRKYQRTFIDIYTGIQFAVVTNTMTAEDTINSFLLAEKYFSFKILGVQSDNGSENRGDFHKHLTDKGIAHYFIPKSSPTWDGKRWKELTE